MPRTEGQCAPENIVQTGRQYATIVRGRFRNFEIDLASRRNLRKLVMALPGTRTRAEHVISSKKPASQEGTAPVRPPSATVRGQNGPKPKAVAGSGGWLGDIRFRSESGHLQRTSACPLSANTGH